jgi:glutamate 5-kinase
MQVPAKIVVIKLGSGVLTHGDRVALHGEQFEMIVTAVAGVLRSGYRPVVVSSGAVAAGLMAFKMDSRPEDMATLQACAAVGQARLMHYYESLFRLEKINVAQLLVTYSDFATPERGGNVKRTLDRLLAFPDVIPIVNENDSVATEELKFGDNDALSAKLAVLAGAEMLILFTGVDGLHDFDDPDEGAIIERVEDVEAVMGLANDETGALSVGGMQTKLQAVKLAVGAGIETVIASGYRPEQLPDLIAGGGRCTRFVVAGS